MGLQLRAVTTEQAVAIADGIHVVGSPMVRVGKRKRDGSALPKARPNSTDPTAGQGAYLPAGGDPVGGDHGVPTVLCGEKWRRALTIGAHGTRQGSETEYVWGYRPRSRGGPPRQRQPREAMKRTTRPKERRPKASSHLNVVLGQLPLPWQKPRKP